MGHDWIGDVPDELLRDRAITRTASCSASSRRSCSKIAE